MEITVLGAHNIESATSRMTSLLIDGVLAVDAGALTSSLSFEQQKKLKSILLTHCHYDHIRDIPAIAINMSYFRQSVAVYSLQYTLDVLSDNVLNGVIYPKFDEIPTPENPPVRYYPVETARAVEVDGYRVLPVPVRHAVETVGYQITAADGKSVFYSGDTGPGLAECWKAISPQLMIVDVTMPDRLVKHGVSTGHLTPRLLGEELAAFGESRGYLPDVLLIHFAPQFEDEIRGEAERVSRELGASVTLSHEGMTIRL
jgi:ribonuclease BN (tRNA processing enzyme)